MLYYVVSFCNVAISVVCFENLLSSMYLYEFIYINVAYSYIVLF